jgi:hypothetical protein
MCTKTKIWKPGQLVTIDNKVYRIVKGICGCRHCKNIGTNIWKFPCVVCIAHKHPFRPWILKELNPNTFLR